MQKIVYVFSDELDEVNEMLADGWIVKDMKPVPSTEDASHSSYCYILLEK